jgi:outer membrane protein OmpA-like peptidoglycan-associated protein
VTVGPARALVAAALLGGALVPPTAAIPAGPDGPRGPAGPVGRAAPAGAQETTTTRPATGAGDDRTGPARTSDLRIRVVDLSVRTEATDGSERSVESPDERTLTFAADVLFDVDQAVLTGDARQRLADVAAELDELGGRTVTIEGHTDDQGDTAHNQELSERRAESVRANLAVQLDDGFTLETVGYGETRPVVPNESRDGTPDPEGRARNRRVVVSYPLG